MTRCILCFSQLTQHEKPEHILLNALGGRKTTKRVLCSLCNEKMGSGPDFELATSTNFIRNIMGFKSGSGKLPPIIKRLKVNDTLYNLNPYGRPDQLDNKVLKFIETDDGIIVEIKARDQAHLKKLKPNISKKLNISMENVEKLLSQSDFEFRSTPAPSMQMLLDFGGSEPMRSMAKSCLVLWALKYGNEEINSNKYDDIRSFILNGGEQDIISSLTRLDTRDLTVILDKFISFSPNPILIYVSSNQDGKVIGYYILYGILAWAFELCSREGPLENSIGLVSDPYDTSNWSDEISDKIPFYWLENANFQQGDKFPSIKFTQLYSRFHTNSVEREIEVIISDAIQKHGLTDCDKITDDFILEISERIAALITRTSTARKIQNR